MKTASPQLKAFLIATQNLVKADLFTITLNGGTPLRWTNRDRAIKFGGFTFEPGPTISDSGVKQTVGVKVDGISITMAGDERHTINGLPLSEFARRNGLDGAIVQIDRIFGESYDQLYTVGPTGSYVRFKGKFSEALDGSDDEITLMAASWLELLDVNMPADLYQASCLNALFDGRCGLSRAAYEASSAVASGLTPTTSSFRTGLAQANGYYALGTIVFTSGANNGLRRTIRSYANSGGLVGLVLPLPAAPAIGDTFKAYPGCDLAQATCSGKFNNLLRFRGQPYIPEPETAL